MIKNATTHQMNISKTHTFESRKYPGCIVTLKRIGPKKRAEIELEIAGARARQRELAADERGLEPELKWLIEASEKDADGKVIEEKLSQQAVLMGLRLLAIKTENEYLIRSQMEPAYVRAGLKSISELTYEGQPATADLLCELGPDDLFAEVVREIEKGLRLSAGEAENLESPTTSVAPVDGKIPDTNATPANPEAISPLSGIA